MEKQRVFLTGATGGMGFASLKEMLKDSDKQDIFHPYCLREKRQKTGHRLLPFLLV